MSAAIETVGQGSSVVYHIRYEKLLIFEGFLQLKRHLAKQD
jgi:hypothetical protein